MWILPLLGYLGLALGFSFLTLSIASGLYYLSELVEEHSVLSAKVLRRMIYGICVVQFLLAVVDSFPWHLTALGIISHVTYLSNLRHFPIVKLSDPLFLLSCVLVLVNHWVWFRHFSSPTAFQNQSYTNPRSPRDRYGYSGYNPNQPSFTEIASYFGICVWLVPFALFVSLSAGENVLPSMGSEYATGGAPNSMSGNIGRDGQFKKGHRRKNTGIAKATIGGVQQWVGETGAVMGLWKAENVKNV